jgi:uncharacterized glyoxalase superfamily protein PhnB
MAHSFESVLFSENHSHKLLGADFYAHGADVSLGIKGLDAGMDLTALKFGVGMYILDVNIEVGAIKVGYEKIRWKYSRSEITYDSSWTIIDEKHSVEKIKVQFNEVEGTSVLMHGDSITQTSTNQVLFHGSKGINLFADGKELANDFPDVPILDVPPVPNQIQYIGAEAALDLAQKMVPPDHASVSSQEILLSDMKKSLNEWRGKKIKEHFAKHEANVSREPEKPYDGRAKDNHSQLQLKESTVVLSSLGKGKAMTELVLNGDTQAIELNLRDANARLNAKDKNITQKFDLTKQSYFVTNYTKTDKYSLFWMTDQEGPVVDEKQMTVNSAGLWTQSDAKKNAKLKLDSALHQIELAVQKDEKNSIVQMLNAKKGEYSLEVKVANKREGAFTMSKDAAALSVKEHGSIVIDSKGATIKAPKDILIESEKGEIDLAAKKVKVSTSTFTKGEVKIPARSVSLGNGSNTIKAAIDGVTIKGSKISLNGTSMLQIKTAIAKIG